MTLRTRKPTGAVPWPLVLIEGPEKSGKSWSCAELSASPKVGRTLWLDLNEGAADEYGSVPGARYEVIEHDGSWSSICGQVAAAKDEAARAAAAGEPPVALIVDSVTAEWDLLKDWASGQAAKSDSNKKRLRDDPGAEVKIPMNVWNDATSRHRRLMTMLMTFPGIVVMTARGKEVASLDSSGRPVEGTKEYKVEGHKTLAYDASVWVRLSRDKAPVVVGARSVHTGIRPGIDEPQEAKDFTLEWLVFDALRCDPRQAHARDLVGAKAERTPAQIRDEALETTTGPDRMRELYEEARDAGCDGAEVINGTGDQEVLSMLLYRLSQERQDAQPEPAPRRPAVTPPPIRAEDQGARKPEQAEAAEDAEWVAGFYIRLNETGEDGLGDLQREVGRAIAARKILADTGGELSAAIRVRRNTMTSVPA